MRISPSTRNTMLAIAAFTLAACGGGSDDATVQDTPSVQSEEQTSIELAAAQAKEEAVAQDALLKSGLPALIAFRKPEFALLDFFRGRHLFERRRSTATAARA